MFFSKEISRIAVEGIPSVSLEEEAGKFEGNRRSQGQIKRPRHFS
jgi:hypothetical protein